MEPGAPTAGGMEHEEDGWMDGDHQHDAEEENTALKAGRVDTQLSRDRPACVWPKTLRQLIKGTSKRRLEIQTAANNVGQNPRWDSWSLQSSPPKPKLGLCLQGAKSPRTNWSQCSGSI